MSFLDYDNEEPKKKATGGKCMKGNRCGKAEKDPKDGKKGTYTLFHSTKYYKIRFFKGAISFYLFQIMITIMKNQRKTEKVENVSKAIDVSEQRKIQRMIKKENIFSLNS